MANQTRRFGLTTFDTPTDELSAQNHKFTDSDRLLLDRLLRIAVEDHVHTGTPATAVAPAAPELIIERSGGAIRANVAAHYRYSIIDSRGQETIASTTATVNTPVPVSTPEYAPRLSRESGVLEAGEYHYAVSACTVESMQETLAGPLATGTLSDFGGWRLDLPPPPSGSGFFNIYRKGPREPELLHWKTTTPDERFVIDDGDDSANPMRKAPVANTTNNTNTIGVQLPGPFPEGSWTWKLFRTYDPTNWENSLLQWIGADDYYVDDGRATQAGFPPGNSAAVGGAPKIKFVSDTTGVLPEAAATGTTRLANFYADVLAIGPGGWEWVNEYEHAELQSMRATVNRFNPPTGDCQVGLDCRVGGTWTPLEDTTSATPLSVVSTISAGEVIGDEVTLQQVALGRGDRLRIHIYVDGYDAAVDHDLTLTVRMRVHNGLTSQTYQWETT